MDNPADLTGPLEAAVASGRMDMVIVILIGILALAIAFMIGRHIRSGAAREATAQQTVGDLVRDLMGQQEKRFSDNLKTEREWREALKRDVDRCEADRVKLSNEVGTLMNEVAGLKTIIAKNGYDGKSA